MWLIHMWHVMWLVYVMRLIYMWDMTHLRVTWLVDVTWRFHMCDMTHSYMTWLIDVTCLKDICDMTHSYLTWLLMGHDSLIGVTWLIDMTPFKTPFKSEEVQFIWEPSHSQLLQSWVAPQNAWHDSLTGLIRGMHLRHNPFIRVTWLICLWNA